jgi:head-tail adaptor
MPLTTVPIGRRSFHRVRVQNPSTPQSLGGDLSVEPWIDASPSYWYVGIAPVLGTDQEMAKSEGTVLTQASTVVTGAYRSDITTASRFIDETGLVLEVLSVESPGRRNFELVCRCSEVRTS